ncbi:hypothetical protein GLOIN_2v1786279 [Rhizophagus irregularis DAOM 181602=DAOM 197198]|uniref:DUF7276 domain-containing protein n=1 Tax=Rhizophagus irregularis (strain DAOM 181602 / DAOM 197198 / MUCL 43194) TaxID=747089 RepID=A0A2P4P8F9_RHIID|nr:hypothetical protein GLOIN_2v1786279 [Rhizophagus irregularis DAOM 181602=DAOM 197198]POG61675.1 hypothetical protein GLOIN_2v1786279 [Rhizophagus irregularis DAOM 181602=DAOM 197198]|eukprot:XP_025168541.1 hypothetical protein GLOIN_2v1786279 [Rhizophagus irregularis DAOM 181602=DAOM 197198]
MINKSYILATNDKDILHILEVIKYKDEKDRTSLIDHPVLIGSRAAKWHIPFFRDPNDWDLMATIPQSISFINIIHDKNYNNDSDDKSYEFDDPLNIHPHYDLDEEKYFKLTLTSKNVFTFNSFEGIMAIRAKPADYVANKLKIPNVNGDLLYKYVLYYLNPSFNENSRLRHHIDELIAEENISNISVTQHPWYSAWNYTLKNKQ